MLLKHQQKLDAKQKAKNDEMKSFEIEKEDDEDDGRTPLLR